MTLTIDVSPERQSVLDQEAARRGVSPEQFAGDLLAAALEDLEDVTEAWRRLAEDGPTVPWGQVKAELNL